MRLLTKFHLSCSFVLAFILFNSSSIAQIPDGYYHAANGKTGNELKIALHNIIKGHSSISYSGLWSAYLSTDTKPGGNKIWDIYSDIPGGTPAYEFIHSTDQCGGSSPSSEGNCYNREHIWPQSLFDGNMPMYSDLWLVYPTDALVNSKRSNYPFGEVASHTWISTNGSKLGTNIYSGAPSTICFEPIDSFKGDIARSYFYIATRYYSQDGGWGTWEMSTGADLKPWAKEMLLSWHHLDPVSQKEIDRNNAVYAIQNNRNPFIDYPEFADCIFGTADCTELLSIHTNFSEKSFQFYPNPANDYLFIINNSLEKIEVITVYSILGQKISDISFVNTNSNYYQLNLNNVKTGWYFISYTSEKGNTFTTKILKQ